MNTAPDDVIDCVTCHRWLDEVEPGMLPGICADCENGQYEENDEHS